MGKTMLRVSKLKGVIFGSSAVLPVRGSRMRSFWRALSLCTVIRAVKIQSRCCERVRIFSPSFGALGSGARDVSFGFGVVAGAGMIGEAGDGVIGAAGLAGVAGAFGSLGALGSGEGALGSGVVGAGVGCVTGGGGGVPRGGRRVGGVWG